MLNEVVSDFIATSNSIITGSTGNGATSLTLFFVNCLLKKDVKVLYYNPTRDIDVRFVKKFYPRTYTSSLFFNSDISTLINYLLYINYDIDYLVIDPGDTMMVNKKILPLLYSVLNEKNKKLIITSQIRQDPTKGGQVYSPIEKLNSNYNNTLFKYSIWIRNVTEGTSLYTSRYVDVFDGIREGNKYIRRYVAKFNDKEGNIVL